MAMNLTTLTAALQQKADAALQSDDEKKLLLLAKAIESVQTPSALALAEQALAEMRTDIEGKQPLLESGVSVKTINGESLLGAGNIVTSGAASRVAPVNSGLIDLGQAFPTVNFGSLNTSYQWLIQRTDGVTAEVGQFASIQGGPRTVADGGCMGTLLPFQIDSAGNAVVGTPTTMWVNPQGSSDFSTCSLLTDEKSGAFHYSGNIPWPGNTSHLMGYGTGVLNANNTAGGFWNSGTDNAKGIHNHNGQYRAIPDADGSGWYGVNAGYAPVDSITRHHFCNFSSPASPIVSVVAPGANTSNSPIAQMLLQPDTHSTNTPIAGVTHWRNSSNRVIARVYGFSPSSFNDFDSGGDWGRYSSSVFVAVALSTGKTLVIHEQHGAESWLYTSLTSRSKVTTVVPHGLFSWAQRMIPVGPDTWIVPSVLPTVAGEIRFSKFSIDPVTCAWTYHGESVSYAAPFNYMLFNVNQIRPLPGNRLAVFCRQSSRRLWYVVVDTPTEWSFI